MQPDWKILVTNMHNSTVLLIISLIKYIFSLILIWILLNIFLQRNKHKQFTAKSS